MSRRSDSSGTLRKRSNTTDIAFYGIVAGAVFLGWQIAVQPLIQRAPPELAVRIAPSSPIVLRRAAESELGADRNDNAAALAREALARAPFDVRTLRIIGLTEARASREEQADQILTLAGNWSLRDDPAHAWLVERRLRRGDYASSFAHADTLVRRREDLQPQIFELFNVAGEQDPQRSLPAIADLLSVNPPWRTAYLSSLKDTPKELQQASNLAILLEGRRVPLANDELQYLYRNLAAKGYWDTFLLVRRRLNRPPPGTTVTNGEFSDDTAPEPFQWRLFQKAGIYSEIVADDVDASNRALRVDYDGFASGLIAEQLTTLPPGRYRLVAAMRVETGTPTDRLRWTVYCANDARNTGTIAATSSDTAVAPRARLVGDLEVPANCPAQWLRLETHAGDRRSPAVVWFDNIAITPLG